MPLAALFGQEVFVVIGDRDHELGGGDFLGEHVLIDLNVGTMRGEAVGDAS